MLLSPVSCCMRKNSDQISAEVAVENSSETPTALLLLSVAGNRSMRRFLISLVTPTTFSVITQGEKKLQLNMWSKRIGTTDIGLAKLKEKCDTYFRIDSSISQPRRSRYSRPMEVNVGDEFLYSTASLPVVLSHKIIDKRRKLLIIENISLNAFFMKSVCAIFYTWRQKYFTQN